METLPGIDPAVSITKTDAPDDLSWCAGLMASNEPWITLQRNYEDAITLLQNSLSEVYLLRQNKQPIGFVLIKIKGSFTGYIQTIALLAEARGLGIGEAVIRHMEELIFQTRPNVFICASSFNIRAQKLYLRMGYEVVGILKYYVLSVYDEVLMRKTRGSLHDFKNQKPANA